jgi:hypothetical protein
MLARFDDAMTRSAARDEIEEGQTGQAPACS